MLYSSLRHGHDRPTVRPFVRRSNANHGRSGRMPRNRPRSLRLGLIVGLAGGACAIIAVVRAARAGADAGRRRRARRAAHGRARRAASRPWANCWPECADRNCRARSTSGSTPSRQHLGKSMQTSTKHTTENLQKLHERLAVIDNAQKNITDLASQVTSLQTCWPTSSARRVRPGPHGSDHPGRTAEGRLRIPVHALEPHAARIARSACRTSGRW